MIKRSKPKFKNTGDMLAFLKEMGKRNEAALKKSEAALKESEKKFQKEMADYIKKYGE